MLHDDEKNYHIHLSFRNLSYSVNDMFMVYNELELYMKGFEVL